MSILDGLRAMVPDRSYALDELTGTQAYEWALNDVREALANPTDEQVDAIISTVTADGWYVSAERVRRVLAAAAGGDR